MSAPPADDLPVRQRLRSRRLGPPRTASTVTNGPPGSTHRRKGHHVVLAASANARNRSRLSGPARTASTVINGPPGSTHRRKRRHVVLPASANARNRSRRPGPPRTASTVINGPPRSDGLGRALHRNTKKAWVLACQPVRQSDPTNTCATTYRHEAQPVANKELCCAIGRIDRMMFRRCALVLSFHTAWKARTQAFFLPEYSGRDRVAALYCAR